MCEISKVQNESLHRIKGRGNRSESEPLLPTVMQILVMKIVFFPIFCFLNVCVCFSFSWKVFNGNNLVIKVHPSGRHRERTIPVRTLQSGVLLEGDRGGPGNRHDRHSSPRWQLRCPRQAASGRGRGGQGVESAPSSLGAFFSSTGFEF